MKKLFVLILVFSNTALAYDGWSIGKIVKLRYQGHATLISQISASNPGECDNTGYIALKEDGSDFTKRAGAALLAAQMSGRSVKLALTGCYNGETSGYPVITEVWITNN